MIVTLTFNPAVDHTVRLSERLRADMVQRSDRDRFDAAGKGINVAKFLDALELPVAATGPVGGFAGDLIREELLEDGIEIAFTNISGRTRVNTTIEAADGEYKVNMEGPELSDHDITAVEAQVDRLEPGLLVMGGSLPPGMTETDIAGLADRDCDVALDVGGDVIADLEQPCFLVKPNEEELAAATGKDIDTVDDAVAAARHLHADGFEHVLCSLGADGAVLVTDDGAWRAEARDCAVADTVGAGDAVLAGYVAGLRRGDDHAAALGLAMELAARVVELSGPQVPDLEGIDAAAAEIAVERLG